MLRLEILLRGLDLGKCLSISERKHFPTFVATFLLNGGLNHRIFLCRLAIFVLLNAANSPLVKLWIVKADLDGAALLYATGWAC